MKDNDLEKKLRKFKENLRLNLEVKYLGRRKEPGSGCIEFTFLVTLIRPESETPRFIESFSTLVYLGQIKKPSLTSIFRSFLATQRPLLEEYNIKRIQALRTFFTDSEIKYLHDLVFQPEAE